MTWALLGVAAAWEPADITTVELPATPRALGVLASSRGPVVLVADGTHLFALLDREIVARRAHGASALAVVDVDGDSQPEIFLCGLDGLEVSGLDALRLTPPVRIDEHPCEALAVRRADAPEVVFTGPDGTRRLTTVDDLPHVEDLGLSVDGDPILVVTDTLIALGAVGSRSLLLLDDRGGAVLPLGGPLRAATRVGEDLAWTHGLHPNEVQFGRERVAFDDDVAGVAGASGLGLVVWSDTAWLQPSAPLPPGPPVEGHLNDDSCTDLWIPTENGYIEVTGRCNETAMDLPVAAPEGASDTTPPTADDSWPPRAWTEGPRLEDSALPSLPGALDLAEMDATLQVFVGQDVRVPLTIERQAVERLEDAPPGAHLEAGAFVYTPEAWEIGRWAVAAKAGGRWRRLTVEVWPRPREGEPLPVESSPRAATAQGDVTLPHTGFLHMDHCTVGMGIAAGASQGGGLQWESLGDPDVLASWSPAVAASCTGGGLLGWTFGVDSAPWFRYTDLPIDRSHLIGATASLHLGTDRFHAGPYGSAGVTAINLGLRAQGFLTERWGMEVRAGWLAPRAGVEGTLLLVRRWRPRHADVP